MITVNKESWKAFIQAKGIEKWFQRDNLIILVLAGILLLVIALPTKDTSKAKEGIPQQSKQNTIDTTQNLMGSTTEAQSQSKEQNESDGDYLASLETRLQKIISGMGVGKVRVMITLQSSEELVVEKDKPLTRATTTERDSEGGSRDVYQTDTKEETIYTTVGNDSQPYVIKTLMPTVEGVVVVAEGAGIGENSKNISEAVQALFGIEAHKIKVLKLKNNSK